MIHSFSLRKPKYTYLIRPSRYYLGTWELLKMSRILLCNSATVIDYYDTSKSAMEYAAYFAPYSKIRVEFSSGR